MIRTVTFLSLIAGSISIASCFRPTHCNRGIDKVVREALMLVKKEIDSTIQLTAEQVERKEMTVDVGNKIIDSLGKTLKQFDSWNLLPTPLYAASPSIPEHW